MLATSFAAQTFLRDDDAYISNAKFVNRGALAPVDPPS
jgi:hypothetical protein